ncbi:MAG: methionine--tRNA ligase [Dehalococcoidia bacterium]
MPRKILVAVAWPYVNGQPHLGHIAGMCVPADIFARYHRLAGNDVVMVSGSDQHGTPVALRALDEGVHPSEIADRYHRMFADAYHRMGFSFDLYTTTGTENHLQVVHSFFKNLSSKGFLYEATQRMPFSETEQRFLSDRFVEGTCPHCGYDSARGDQCDNCGRTLDPVDLINIRSKRDGSVPVFKDTVHQFLKLSAFQKQLEEWVAGRDDWRTNVRNTTLSWLREGLHDRAVTRDIEWGIPVPLPGYEKKRIYVWFEAVMGYLSATKEWANLRGRPDAWKDWWENPEAESYYFQGKDNIPFHTIIWPSILMGRGGLNLPTDVVANEFLRLEGDNFSTSRNYAVWLPDYLERYDPDPLRYYLASIMPETSDSDFTWAGFLAANNNELVATLGNFIHRVLTITTRNFDGVVPSPGELDDDDREVLAACDTALGNVAQAIEDRHFRDGLRAAMALAQAGNRYIDGKAPWTQVKNDRPAAATTLWTALNVVATLRTVFYPFVPFAAEKTHQMLALEGDPLESGWKRTEIKPGAELGQPVPLFRKLDDSIVEDETARLGAPGAGTARSGSR